MFGSAFGHSLRGNRSNFPLASGENSCHNWSTARHLAALPEHSRKATLACFYKPVSVVLSLRPPGPVDMAMRHGAGSGTHAFELKILWAPSRTKTCPRGTRAVPAHLPHKNAVRSPQLLRRKCVPCGEDFPYRPASAGLRSSLEAGRQENWCLT